jgi:hypothetical protein
MTQLICKVCRCNLKDGRLIKENEIFETTDEETEILIRGGIAKPAPAPVKKPEPVKVDPPKPAIDLYKEAQKVKELKVKETPKETPVQPEAPKKAITKKKSR